MMKKSTNKKVKQLNPEIKKTRNDTVADRKVKTQKLTTVLFDTIKTESEKNEFTIHELMDVLIKIQHSFNKRFLDADNDQLMNQENPDN